MPRDPTEVIDKLLEHIPQKKCNLRAQLSRIKNNAFFVAPECMGRIWDQIALQLNECLNNPPLLNWEKRVANIIADKEIFEITD